MALQEKAPPSGEKQIVVRPGQTLVIGYSAPVSESQAEVVKARLRERLPGVDIVVIGHVQQMLVYEPADGPQ